MTIKFPDINYVAGRNLAPAPVRPETSAQSNDNYYICLSWQDGRPPYSIPIKPSSPNILQGGKPPPLSKKTIKL